MMLFFFMYLRLQICFFFGNPAFLVFGECNFCGCLPQKATNKMHQAKPLVHFYARKRTSTAGRMTLPASINASCTLVSNNSIFGWRNFENFWNFHGKNMDESDEHGWNLTPPKKNGNLKEGVCQLGEIRPNVAIWRGFSSCFTLTCRRPSLPAQRNIKLYIIYIYIIYSR